MMKDYPPQNPPWLAPPTGPVKAAAPLPSERQAPTSKPNAGDELKNFRFTNEERIKVYAAITARIHNMYVTEGLDNQREIKDCVDRIEEIINHGWQTCACDVDKAGANF